MESDVLDIWLKVSKNSLETALKIVHNLYYARFGVPGGIQRVIMGRGLVPSVSESAKSSIYYNVVTYITK